MANKAEAKKQGLDCILGYPMCPRRLQLDYPCDSLGRLATACTTGTQWGLSWTYDGFGNRLRQDLTKGTAPSIVQTVNPATNRLNGAGFVYDANGNMTDWSTPSGPVTAAYDIDNRMKNITTPNVTETYQYGPGNLRVRKAQGGITTYSVYGQGGELLGTYNQCSVAGTLFLCDARLRVYFGGRLILNGWAGVKPDRLGSPDGTHGRVYPYGEVAGSVYPDQEETFTTYKRDTYTGLDNAWNRSYASEWGRFTTADPYKSSGGAASPESWNRYSYVQGDPSNLSDPLGLMAQAPNPAVGAMISYCQDQLMSIGGSIGMDSLCWATLDANYFEGVVDSVSTYDPPEPTCKDALAGSIQGFLSAHKSSLASSIDDLMMIGERYDIDPRLFAAIATAENGIAKNNPFGLRIGSRFRTFSSLAASIEFLGKTLDRFIHQWNESTVSGLYSGKPFIVRRGKPWIVIQYPGYCVGAGCQRTGATISEFMKSMGGNPDDLDFPCDENE